MLALLTQTNRRQVEVFRTIRRWRCSDSGQGRRHAVLLAGSSCSPPYCDEHLCIQRFATLTKSNGLNARWIHSDKNCTCWPAHNTAGRGCRQIFLPCAVDCVNVLVSQPAGGHDSNPCIQGSGGQWRPATHHKLEPVDCAAGAWSDFLLLVGIFN